MSSTDPDTILQTEYLVSNSPSFKRMANRLGQTTSLSMSGITNFVVNYENPAIVKLLLENTFPEETLFHETVELDAVGLQQGRPGKGASIKYFDDLLYGTAKVLKDEENNTVKPDIDPRTGLYIRNPNGFANRAALYTDKCKDKTLIIHNIDQCLDFCPAEKPGKVDSRSLFLFDKFRKPSVKRGCKLLLVTNEKLMLPFDIKTIEMPKVGPYEVKHLINVYLFQFRQKGLTIPINAVQVEQIVRKLSGLTYSAACDALAFSIVNGRSKKNPKIVDMNVSLRCLRKEINQKFMSDGAGLTQLESRPWEDYICPEQSNFTHDVDKLLRDFKEVGSLIEKRKDFKSNNESLVEVDHNINALKSRMPHVIVLYGQGGVGKSAFPVHLGGLLDMDVWDFNINSTHDKYIGESSKKVRESIEKISNSSHVIVRIDEYDRAIGSNSSKGQGMHSAHKQVESEFMNWLQNGQEEGLFVKNNIFLVLTTNHLENITGPMLRSGRADLVIDIGEFDSSSMEETFKTCAKRMKNRNAPVVGFHDADELQEAINSLDLEKLSEIANSKKFTVRDIEHLIIEMSAYKYYYDNSEGKEGIPWTTDAFVKVLENSEGSVKGDTTGELKLGDREYFKEDIEDVKIEFGDDSIVEVEKLEEISGFQEK